MGWCPLGSPQGLKAQRRLRQGDAVAVHWAAYRWWCSQPSRWTLRPAYFPASLLPPDPRQTGLAHDRPATVSVLGRPIAIHRRRVDSLVAVLAHLASDNQPSLSEQAGPFEHHSSPPNQASLRHAHHLPREAQLRTIYTPCNA